MSTRRERLIQQLTEIIKEGDPDEPEAERLVRQAVVFIANDLHVESIDRLRLRADPFVWAGRNARVRAVEALRRLRDFKSMKSFFTESDLARLALISIDPRFADIHHEEFYLWLWRVADEGRSPEFAVASLAVQCGALGMAGKAVEDAKKELQRELRRSGAKK